MFSAPQGQLKVAFDRGSSKARSTEPVFGSRPSLGGQGPLTGVSRTPRQLRQHSSSFDAAAHKQHSLTVSSGCVSRTCAVAEGATGCRSPLVGHEGLAQVPQVRGVCRRRCPLGACPQELAARGALPWAARPGAGEAEACCTPPPCCPLLGAASCHPGHLPRLAGHNGPRPHSRSAPREVAAPLLPRPGPAGACVEEQGEEAGAWRDAGLT